MSTSARLRSPISGRQNEVLLGDDVCSRAVDALQGYRVGPVDRDLGIESEVDDVDSRGEIGGRYSERLDVEQILPARWVGVESRDRVFAEPCGENERVVAGTAIHGVVAGAAIQGVIACAEIGRASCREKR